MNQKEIEAMIKKQIDKELEKTPDDMRLNVEILVEKEGIRLNFTRTKINGQQRNRTPINGLEDRYAIHYTNCPMNKMDLIQKLLDYLWF